MGSKKKLKKIKDFQKRVWLIAADPYEKKGTKKVWICGQIARALT